MTSKADMKSYSTLEDTSAALLKLDPDLHGVRVFGCGFQSFLTLRGWK